MLVGVIEASGSGNLEPLKTGHHTKAPYQFPAKASCSYCRSDFSAARPKMESKF